MFCWINGKEKKNLWDIGSHSLYHLVNGKQFINNISDSSFIKHINKTCKSIFSKKKLQISCIMYIIFLISYIYTIFYISHSEHLQPKCAFLKLGTVHRGPFQSMHLTAGRLTLTWCSRFYCGFIMMLITWDLLTNGRVILFPYYFWVSMGYFSHWVFFKLC